MNAGRIAFFATVAFFINATFADNFIFDDANDIFRAVYSNCTEAEYNLRKCINGVCLARTDTLVRQSLCLCFKDFEGARCARSFLPNLSIAPTFYILFVFALIIPLAICVFSYKQYKNIVNIEGTQNHRNI